MTALKTSAFVVAVVVAFALGVWARPSLNSWWTARQVSALVPPAPAEAAAPVTPTPAAHMVRMPSRLAIAPALADRVHPLMTRGTNMTIAEKGFENAQQFAAVAHASYNLDVPFVVMKDKVLNRHESLSRAIHEMKPGVNAPIEAARAVAEARSDVAAARRAVG